MSREFKITYGEYVKRREELARPDVILKFIREETTPFEIKAVIVQGLPPRPFIPSGINNQRVDSDRTNPDKMLI